LSKHERTLLWMADVAFALRQAQGERLKRGME
jgi:hypothetical protein